MSAIRSSETILVGPLSAVQPTVRRYGATHLVTLINDHMIVRTPPTISPERHLRLAMNDISEPQPGLVPPGEDHVSELIDFAISWDRRAPMLIHCWAGISRSTAAAFITLCTLNPRTDEHHIAGALRAASPTATPNRRLVALADSMLGRQGRMIGAVEAIGLGEMVLEAEVFALPAQIGV